jgi:hypothetical protein
VQEAFLKPTVIVFSLLAVMFLLACSALFDGRTIGPSDMEPIASSVVNTLTPNLEGTTRQYDQTAAPIASMWARLDATIYAYATDQTLLPTPTPTPTPPWSAPLATEVLARAPGTVTETLIVQMLRTYSQEHSLKSLYVLEGCSNFFNIEVIEDNINLVWDSDTGITNEAGPFRVFFSWPPEPNWSEIPEEFQVNEWTKWSMADKMLIENSVTGKVYWVKWVDYMPWRPIMLDGWATEGIFVFSQFGNPWHGFLTAINAQERKFLCTIGLEYW